MCDDQLRLMGINEVYTHMGISVQRLHVLRRRPGGRRRVTRRRQLARWLRRAFTRSKCGCSCRSCRTYCGACNRFCERV